MGTERMRKVSWKVDFLQIVEVESYNTEKRREVGLGIVLWDY